MEEVKNTTDENTLVNKYKRLAEIYKEDVPYIKHIIINLRWHIIQD